MFGFFIGTASLIGLFMVLRRHRWYGHGWGWRHGNGHGGYGREARRSWLLRWLFRHLDTTPGQEKVFNDAAEDLEGRAREMRSELEQLRKELGRTLKLPQFDAATVRETFARQRAHMDTLEESLIGHLEKIHGALDERQRGVFAELIQDGPRRAMHRCGGYEARGHGEGRGSWRTA
jgi:hypothetical protein